MIDKLNFNEQRATSNEQRATSNEQRATSNEQRATSKYKLNFSFSQGFASLFSKYFSASHSHLPASRSHLPASRSHLPASHSQLPASRSHLPTPYFHLPKYYLLIICLGFWNLGFSQSFGTFASAVSIQIGNNAKFYNLEGTGIHAIGGTSNFSGANLGTFSQFSIGAEIKTWKQLVANVCGAKLHYAIYPAGNRPATLVFNTIDLAFKENCGGTPFPSGGSSFPTGGPCHAGDQKWQILNQNVQGNTCGGSYQIEVYMSYYGSDNSNTACNTTKYINNGGSNYIANFTIASNPLPSILKFSYDVAGNQIKREFIANVTETPNISIVWQDTNNATPKTTSDISYTSKVKVNKEDISELITLQIAQKSKDGINWENIKSNFEITNFEDLINTNGTLYYRVVSYECNGSAYNSNVLQITRNYNTPPTVQIRWTNSSTYSVCITATCIDPIIITKTDVDNDIQVQEVQRSTDNINWTTIGSSTTPNIPTTLTDPITTNGIYYYRVMIKDNFNPAVYSKTIRLLRNYNNCPLPKLISVTRIPGTETVTYVWENNIAFTGMFLQYSTDNGATWSYSIGSATSPQNQIISNTATNKNILFRIERQSPGCNNAISNIINYGIWTPPLSSHSASALGAYYHNSICGSGISINTTGSALTTNFLVDKNIGSSNTPSSYIGVQIYLPNEKPATYSNCAAYYSVSNFGKLNTGLRYVRFYSFCSDYIFLINPDTGKIADYLHYTAGTCRSGASISSTQAKILEDVSVTETNSLQETFKQSLKVYPNPTSGVFSVEWDAVYNDNVEQITITAYNSTFSKNIKYNKTNNKIDVNLSQEPPGIYYLTITLTDGSIVTEKVIKQ